MKGSPTKSRNALSTVSSRGSVLVLVVGVLALMALIVLVYSTIGVGDRRASAALVERSRVDESIKGLRDHMAQVIADSAVAVLPQRITGDTTNTSNRKSFDILQRKAVDIPWTDPEVRSVPALRDSQAITQSIPSGGSSVDLPHQFPTAGDDSKWRKFNATGGATMLWDPTRRGIEETDVEPRTPTTPWLASGEPIWIDAGRPKSPQLLPIVLNNPLDLAKQERDLLHISNISPDGLYINKVALRGNWDAESGLGRDADGDLRTSGSMWLLDHDGNPTQVLQRPLNGGSTVYANPNIPNHWSANQYGLHRPVSLVPKINANPLVPGDPRYPANSFADADGDGAYDSRWAQMIDSSVLDDSVAVVPSPAGLRFIYAAKVVDLSGLANVNTATSFAREPSAIHPAGITPSDLDLERLLAMHDAYREYSGLPNAGVFINYPNPADAARRSNYTVYDEGASGVNLGEYANLIGRSGFSALVASRATGTVPVANVDPDSYFDPDIQLTSPTPIWLQNRAVATDPRDGLMASFGRAQSYYFLGRAPGGIATNDDPSRLELTLNLTFGMADESELRARHGLNDPTRQTRLELTIDGRNKTPALRNFGPMRSNRDGDVESLNITQDNPAGAKPDDQFAMMTATSVRRYLTTTSGARPIRIDPSGLTPVGRIQGDFITPGPITSTEVVPDINPLLDAVYTKPATTDEFKKAVSTIFNGYANALMPDAARVDPATGVLRKVDVWNVAEAQGQTAVYGHRYQYQAPSPSGPSPAAVPLGANAAEYALRTSAALTLNLIAQRDPRVTANGATATIPGTLNRPADDLVVGTLLMNEAARSNLTATASLATGPNGAAADPASRQWSFWNRTPATPAPNDPLPGLIVDLDLNAFDPNLKTAPNAINLERLFDSGRLSTPDHRLSVNDPVAIPARVMFGVRPQPFLTQAAMYQMFGNAEWDGVSDKSAKSRDQEWDPPDTSPLGTGQPIPGPPTIYCKVDPGNSDFLVEMFAFQLTNPFDVELPLTQVDGSGQAVVASVNAPDYRYYVEFNGRFFKVVDAKFSDVGAVTARTGVVLKPGESRTFYVLTQSFDDIRARWQNMGLAGVTNQKIQDWIDRQLETDSSSLGGAGASGQPIRVVEIQFNPSQSDPIELTPATQPPATMVNLLRGSATSDEKRVVRLWRDLRADVLLAGGSVHQQQNDYLVDRLREPEDAFKAAPLATPTRRAVLDCTPFDADKVECRGITSGVPDPRLDQDQYAATRLAFTTFASIRRPDDPNAISNSIPEGSFPAYCIESKNKFDRSNVNIAVIPEKTPGGARPDKQEWYQKQVVEGSSVPFGTEAFAVAGLNLIEQQSVANDHLVPSIGKAAARRAYAGSIIRSNKDTGAQERRSFSDLRVATGVTRKVNNGTTYVMPPLRPADLLVPLAITPSYLPIEGTGTTYTEKLNDRWTTLSEALGLATGYDWVETSVTTPTTLAEHERNYAYRFGDSSETTVDADGRATYGSPKEVSGIVDRGQLVLTRYVPINDSSGNGLFDQYGRTSKIPDPARGLGVPLAFNILNNFRTTSLGSTTSLVPGLVNINTAPRAVLRLLPFMAPDWTPNFSGWMSSAGLNGSAGKFYDEAQSVWDLAAVVAAYRDRTASVTRAVVGSSPLAARTVDFSDYNSDEVTANPDNLYFSTGRRKAANISALRNGPGLLSIGELLAARVSTKLTPTTIAAPSDTYAPRLISSKDRADMSIDRFGRMDDLAVGSTILAPVMSPPTSPSTDITTGVITSQVMPLSGGTDAVAPRLPNGFEQQLSIANAVMNLVTTRSDVFCVWFVVEGYAPGDVEGLKALDTIASEGAATVPPSDPDYDRYARPMTPSVSRRYMMVVDRSNVTSEGQKPRILLFEELPR